MPWEIVKLSFKLAAAVWLMIFFFIPIVTIIVVLGLSELAAEKVRAWRDQ